MGDVKVTSGTISVSSSKHCTVSYILHGEWMGCIAWYWLRKGGSTLVFSSIWMM